MRNFNKAIEDGKQIRTQRDRLDISRQELTELIKGYGLPVADPVIDAVIDAYSAGLAIGLRNGHSREAKLKEA